jgi:HPt (histidine-containing phosphotransfer) domain-containing protein
LHKILLTFVRDHSRDAVAIRRALESGDLKLAKRIAHTLKGMAGSIGAMGLQPAAEDMDAALKNVDAAAYPALLDVLESALTSVTTGLARLDEFDAEERAAAFPTGPTDTRSVLLLLDYLETLLQEMDPDAEITADTLCKHLSQGPAQPLANELVDQLANFDFDAAVHTIARLREMLKVSS